MCVASGLSTSEDLSRWRLNEERETERPGGDPRDPNQKCGAACTALSATNFVEQSNLGWESSQRALKMEDRGRQNGLPLHVQQVAALRELQI